MSLITQLDKLCNIEKLSIIDMKLFIYLHRYCKRTNFIPAHRIIAAELKCNTLSITNSYNRLIERGIIKETRKKKIGHSYCYEFEFI